ncbi:hypothetical protein QBC36DRAFT_289857 [Triangularia setosa]|uniref:Uncharacterized protein n=1 Tax=Triangularia setosa TaxID=2587417 RepID=A0AAN6W875_9PEZI|nr:hypothetical protein QBC36DRAFT_289857 [Podospora setosa]
MKLILLAAIPLLSICFAAPAPQLVNVKDVQVPVNVEVKDVANDLIGNSHIRSRRLWSNKRQAAEPPTPDGVTVAAILNNLQLDIICRRLGWRKARRMVCEKVPEVFG